MTTRTMRTIVPTPMYMTFPLVAVDVRSTDRLLPTGPRTAHSRPIQTSRRIPGSHWLAVKGPCLSRGRPSGPWLQPKIAMRRLRRGAAGPGPQWQVRMLVPHG
jgi:hypothetical protein